MAHLSPLSNLSRWLLLLLAAWSVACSAATQEQMLSPVPAGEPAFVLFYSDN